MTQLHTPRVNADNLSGCAYRKYCYIWSAMLLKFPVLKRISVLVIEQESQLLESVRYNLFLDGFEVYTASNADEAAEFLTDIHTRAKLRLIILDDHDGLDFALDLKREENTRDIPLIVLTESTAISQLEKIFESGADDYITKPFEQENLGKTVKEKLKVCEAAIKKNRKQKRMPILLIDDDASLRKIVEHNLYLDGFKVYTAEDGPSGIEAALKLKPKLILLDVMMPGINGLEVLSTLKYNPRTRKIPVIMMTAETSIANIDRAYAIGAYDYITKPIKISKLGQNIREKLQKQKK